VTYVDSGFNILGLGPGEAGLE